MVGSAAGTVVPRGGPVSLNPNVAVDFTEHCAREGLLPESELGPDSNSARLGRTTKETSGCSVRSTPRWIAQLQMAIAPAKPRSDTMP